jgi:Family of unknown function (DUF5329)
MAWGTKMAEHAGAKKGGTIDLPLSVVTDTMFFRTPILASRYGRTSEKVSSSSVRIVIFALLLTALGTTSHAAEIPPTVEREITMLLNAFGTSDCRFYRNGSWYSASDAQAHLTRKYEYLRQKKLIGSTEDFIVTAGTKSSRSGEPYQVQCGREQSVPSSEWLSAVLHRLRSSPSAESSGQ